MVGAAPASGKSDANQTQISPGFRPGPFRARAGVNACGRKVTRGGGDFELWLGALRRKGLNPARCESRYPPERTKVTETFQQAEQTGRV